MAQIAVSSFGRMTWPRRAPRVGLTTSLQISNEPAVLSGGLLNEGQKVSSVADRKTGKSSAENLRGALIGIAKSIIVTIDALAGGGCVRTRSSGVGLFFA
jgi:hypothetical protein